MSIEAEKIEGEILDMVGSFPSKKLSDSALEGYIKRAQEYRVRTVMSICSQLTRPGKLERQYPNSLPSLFELTELLERQKNFEDGAARYKQQQANSNEQNDRPSTPMGPAGRLRFERDGTTAFYAALQKMTTAEHEAIRAGINETKARLGIGEHSTPEDFQRASKLLGQS
jgi:hypothetical protein